MRVVRLAEDENGNFMDKDMNIVITDLVTWINPRMVRNENNEMVEVPETLTCHCTVTNTRRFLTKLTLIFTSVDYEGYNFGSVTGSIMCFDVGENWEFFGKSENLGYYDPDSDTTGDPEFCRIRGGDVMDYSEDDDGWDIKVYAIEEFNDPDDYTGGLGRQ